MLPFKIYYTWKNIRQQYKNNKLKIIASALNDGFELRDGFYSALVIQYYIEYITKKHEINNMLVFKIKYKYKIEL